MKEVVLLSPAAREGALCVPAIKIVAAADSIDFTGFDALIVTSKTAIGIVDRLNGGWKRLKIFTIGAKTSEEVKRLGGGVFFESSAARGEILAQEIAHRFGHLNFLYPKARESAVDLEQMLKSAGVRVSARVIYETRCAKIDGALLPREAVVIFTSPSTVECFLSQTEWRSGFTAVAIGATTAAALEKRGVKAAISPAPSVEEAILFARK
ncbi:MAG: uroporphyrinogen-III synthase, partial [Helicobacteraceae bacterium]|nr:uroporphyrinogen-III synthase [Helicobacteraceae bacterium]